MQEQLKNKSLSGMFFFYCLSTVNIDLCGAIFSCSHRVDTGAGEITLRLRPEIIQGEVLRPLLQCLLPPEVKNVSNCPELEIFQE